ncbi:MAG: STT3 domain-containing protein, partial [Candidatus Aenigmatarchaeota archaeon]
MKRKTNVDSGALIAATRKNWYLLILLAIFVMAFWVRSFPAKYNELQALDPFYMYRLSKYAVENGLTLPENDALRYFPNGVNAYMADLPGPVFIPAITYLILSGVGLGISYIKFAIIFPAALGAISCVIMFFLAKEFFDKKTGLAAAFFFAVLPAFITRTSAGFFEKESLGAVFILLSMFFFLKSYKDKSWIYGVLAGISLALLGSSWGGARVVYILLPLYGVVMLLLNKDVEKLLPSYVPTVVLGALLTQLYPFHMSLTSSTMLPAFGVLALLAIRVLVEKFNLVKRENLPYVVPILIIASFAVLLVGSVFLDSFSRILTELGGYVAAFFGATSHGSLGSTVAEQLPGDWNSILGSAGANYTSFPLANMSSIWIYTFLGAVLLGVTFGYKIYRRIEVEWPRLLLLIWLLFAIGSVFYMIRLVIFFAFPAAILSGYLFSSLANRLLPKMKTHMKEFKALLFISLLSITGSMVLFIFQAAFATAILGWLTWYMVVTMLFNLAVMGGLLWHLKGQVTDDFLFAWLLIYAVLAAGSWYLFSVVGMPPESSTIIFPPIFFLGLQISLFVKKKINDYSLALALLAIFFAFVAGVNMSNAYNYGNAIGPSICFPNGEECLIFNDDGTYEPNLNNQPWYQAMDFLKNNTTEGASILSWWDFGYWFQTRGEIPSIADGGNINATVDEEIAQWFTAPPENWTQFEPWLKEHKISYILMDYTLPGKYGAISRIASYGLETKGMQQLPYRNMMEQNNKT